MNDLLESLSKINYWDQKPDIDTGFPRTFYLDRLKRLLGNQLIKVVVGQRRAGKSFIIRQLMALVIEREQVAPVNIFYLNKELFQFDEIATATDLNKIIKLYEVTYRPEGKIYIIIDEVQNIDQWEKVIVSLAQGPEKKYEVIITGSNSRLLSGELASLLSGRYILTEVFPFSYDEFLEFNSWENNRDNFIKYITGSGLPEVFNLNSKDIQRNYFQSLKDTVLMKDIMYRHKIRDYVLLGDLFLFLVHNVGNLTSIPSILKYFKSKNRKVDYTTLSSYIAFMQEAFIVHEVPRFSIKTKELLSGEKKYYITDLGFRNYLYPHLINDIGNMLENVVFMHLKKAGFEVKVGHGKSFEIDFFATKNGNGKYIQVAYLINSDETKNREFGAFDGVKDHFPKYVLSLDDLLSSPSSGIIHERVNNFLINILDEN